MGTLVAPKSEASSVCAALADCRGGIRTGMITGDHVHTALAVAKDIGMVKQAERVIVIDTVSQPELQSRAVARLPSHTGRLRFQVSCLQHFFMMCCAVLCCITAKWLPVARLSHVVHDAY